MIPDNIDLTTNRDFGFPETLVSERFMDYLAVASTNKISYALEEAAGVESPTLHLLKIYPWNVTELTSASYLEESFISSDPYSTSLGFELYGDPEHPFVLGSKKTRKVSLYIAQQECGYHCDSCGVKLTFWDEVFSYSDDHAFHHICRNCNKKLIHESRRIPW